MIRLTKYDIKYYIDKLNNGELFTYAKFGDGEMICMLKSCGMGKEYGKFNKGGDKFSTELGLALIDVLKHYDGSYYIATTNVGNGSLSRIGAKLVDQFCNQHGINIEARDADTDLYGSVYNGTFHTLVTAMVKHNLIMVSEISKKQLPIKFSSFVEIPTNDAFDSREDTVTRIVAEVNKYEKPIVCISAGMASLVITDDLFKLVGDKCWIINFGAIWDGFIGNRIRSYHKSVAYEKDLI